MVHHWEGVTFCELGNDNLKITINKLSAEEKIKISSEGVKNGIYMKGKR
jgi:hypothetical protein